MATFLIYCPAFLAHVFRIRNEPRVFRDHPASGSSSSLCIFKMCLAASFCTMRKVAHSNSHKIANKETFIHFHWHVSSARSCPMNMLIASSSIKNRLIAIKITLNFSRLEPIEQLERVSPAQSEMFREKRNLTLCAY